MTEQQLVVTSTNAAARTNRVVTRGGREVFSRFLYECENAGVARARQRAVEGVCRERRDVRQIMQVKGYLEVSYGRRLIGRRSRNVALCDAAQVNFPRFALHGNVDLVVLLGMEAHAEAPKSTRAMVDRVKPREAGFLPTSTSSWATRSVRTAKQFRAPASTSDGISDVLSAVSELQLARRAASEAV